MIVIFGYIGTVVTLSALLVGWILSRPERFNLDEESEALREDNEWPCKGCDKNECIAAYNCYHSRFYCGEESDICKGERCLTQCLFCKTIESKTKENENR